MPPMPENRSATGVAQHPTADKQNESPDPHASAATTGTTCTPTSVGNSPTHGDGAAKTGNVPEFPTDSVRARPPGSMLHGQDSSWPTGLQEGMMNPRYGTPQPIQMDNLPDAPYNASATDPSSYGAASSFPCAIKILVSNNVAGSIIGRAGQTISELQSQSSTRIKLSQTGDYYPGSQDRVCLVQGHVENVKGAVSLLLERLYMLQEHQHSQHLAWQTSRPEGSPQFDFVVRILVPSSCCGMIIGKSGSNIRQMEESSGVTSVRLSPKDMVDPNYSSATITSATSERVVTLTGPTLESCLNCVCIILDGMTLHPDICRYANLTTSYSRLMPDPFSSGQPPPRSIPRAPIHGNEGNLWEPSQYGQAHQGGISRRVSSSPDLSGGFLPHRPPAPIDPGPGPVGGHTSRDAMPYNPMFGGPSPSYSPARPQPEPRMPQNSDPAGPQIYHNPHMENPGSSTVVVPNSVSAPDLLALQIESMQLQSSPSPQQTSILPAQPAQVHQEYPLFPSPQVSAPGMVAHGFSAQVLVPDNMIGSILGRGGKTLNELQAQSGTRIRISQRGEYLPGTRDRIVTVRGPTAQSVSLAQYLMSQRMILPRTATYQVPSNQPPPMPSSFNEDQGGGSVEAGHLFQHAEPQPPQPQGGTIHQPNPPSNKADHSTAT